MKKVLSIIAALTLSVGLWAEAPANVEYVDLGLPSGIKWAACNIGATKPQEYGNYFSWGETEPKDDYSWDKYTYKDNHPDVLPADHDAARLNLGGHWRMPTLDDFEELRNNCKCSYTTNYNNTGVAGCVFTRKDGNSIFFPAAGNHAGNGSNFVGERGYSWLSTLNETNSDEAYGLCFFLKPYEDMGWKVIERYYGLPIRPVYDPSMTPTPISVDYIDENGAEQTADGVNDIAPSDAIVTWGTAGQTTWYVVTGTDVQLTAGAVCQGDVRLILADGAKLTATGFFSNPDRIIYTPGIQVSGDNNSLIIYAQSTDEATMGQLIANGADDAAGIGGGYLEEGSNITINGGIVTANGGKRGAGIGGGFTKCGFNITVNGGIVTANGGNEGAGIGGGGAIALDQSKGYNITINGGIVTANGGNEGAGIGGGAYASGFNITINGGEVIANGGNQAYTAIGGGYHSQTPASNIKVATTFIIKADSNNPPTTVIPNLGLDIANNLKDKRYVTIVNAKIGAIAAINAAIVEEDNDYVKTIATNAIAAINAAASAEIIDALKTQAIDNISSAKAAYAAGDTAGYARGKAEALGTMGEPCDGCTVVEVTDVTTTVKLYNPTKVSYIKE